MSLDLCLTYARSALLRPGTDGKTPPCDTAAVVIGMFTVVVYLQSDMNHVSENQMSQLARRRLSSQFGQSG